MAVLLKGTTLRILLAVIVAVLLAGIAAQWWDEACIRPEPGSPRPMRGEIMVRPGEKNLYFDGRCWTTKRQPPTDTAF
jgi:hypothetical protein